MNEALRGQILDLMRRHGIGYFDYAGPDGSMVLDAEQPEQNHAPVLARSAGIFLSRHPGNREAPVWPRHVRAGEIIGWLKVGPLLEPVRAEMDAPMHGPTLADGSLAGYGDRLF